MAQDIVPIELGLTEGDLVTLWAPRWREDGEEWEAFLGDEDDLFGFPDVASMVAFIRTATEHDLVDHPAWRMVPRLAAPDLVPVADQRYDLVGVPELVAEDPDTWVINELADIVTIVRSLADVCELDEVHSVLDAAPGFAMLDGGTLVFSGREGQRHWDKVSEVVAKRWDAVLDALDEVVRTPDVDAAARASAEAELAEVVVEPTSDDDDSDTDPAETSDEDEDDSAGDAATDGAADEDEAAEDPPLTGPAAFWSEVGIDPVRVISGLGEHYTLRCYVDDAPVFLGRDGAIYAFTTERSLARHLAADDGEHDLQSVVTWSVVMDKANGGELEVEVDDANSYTLTGLADDLAEGPQAVDAVQLELAVELIRDAEEWAGSDTAKRALASSEPLGWLVSFVLNPDPARLAPGAPFDAEVTAWRSLVDSVENRLTVQ